MAIQVSKQKQVITKTYKGRQAQATAAFQADSVKMAAHGYYPTSQSWAPGEYGRGAFLLALLLCFVIIGFFVFIYMVIVKPEGTLSVIYELQSSSVNSADTKVTAEKKCPQCAEQVKAAAFVCRFCGYKFAETKPCPKCAKLSKSSVLFCRYCGHNFAET